MWPQVLAQTFHRLKSTTRSFLYPKVHSDGWRPETGRCLGKAYLKIYPLWKWLALFCEWELFSAVYLNHLCFSQPFWKWMNLPEIRRIFILWILCLTYGKTGQCGHRGSPTQSLQPGTLLRHCQFNSTFQAIKCCTPGVAYLFASSFT